jgi:hypothetical protein
MEGGTGEYPSELIADLAALLVGIRSEDYIRRAPGGRLVLNIVGNHWRSLRPEWSISRSYSDLLLASRDVLWLADNSNPV